MVAAQSLKSLLSFRELTKSRHKVIKRELGQGAGGNAALSDEDTRRSEEMIM